MFLRLNELRRKSKKLRKLRKRQKRRTADSDCFDQTVQIEESVEEAMEFVANMPLNSNPNPNLQLEIGELLTSLGFEKFMKQHHQRSSGNVKTNINRVALFLSWAFEEVRAATLTASEATDWIRDLLVTHHSTLFRYTNYLAGTLLHYSVLK